MVDLRILRSKTEFARIDKAGADGRSLQTQQRSSAISLVVAQGRVRYLSILNVGHAKRGTNAYWEPTFVGGRNPEQAVVGAARPGNAKTDQGMRGSKRSEPEQESTE